MLVIVLANSGAACKNWIGTVTFPKQIACEEQAIVTFGDGLAEVMRVN